MKRLLSLTLITSLVAFAILSCKDDFNEEDFLKLQSDLKLKQDEVMRQRFDSTSEEAVKEYIAALNEAGDLLAVSLVVRENGNALSGVTVTLSSGTPQEASAGGRTNAVTTGTTDASGTVVFDRVTIGAGTATFSKAGYVTATATYNFGTPPAPLAIQVATGPNGVSVTKYVTPAKRFESAAVPMISATPSEGSTATITGKVTIENDLTNLTPEVPTGIVLRANLSNLIAGNQGFITAYTLADNSTLGRATIAADGSYTMIVPATAAGTTINFIIPNIEGTCRMAVNGYDNGTGTAVALTTPEYRNVPTGWGPNSATSGGIPVVPGARIVLPAAPAAGTGLSFTFSPVPRSMQTGIISANTSSAVGLIGDQARYRITNRGSFANTTAPSVTINGTGTGASAIATLQTLINSITVTTAGTLYPNPATVQLVANLQGGGTQVLSQGTVNTVNNAFVLGALDLDALDDGINGGFGTDEQAVAIPSNCTGLFVRAVGGDGTAAFTFTNLIDLRNVTITNGGSGYTSRPTFTLSAGGATIETLEFPVKWDITPVMNAGTKYSVLPASFTINYPPSFSQNGSTSNFVDTFNPNGSSDETNVSLVSRLIISAGDVIKRVAITTIRTRTLSDGQPSVTNAVVTPIDAKATFNEFSFNTTGGIANLPTVNNLGAGYNSKLTAQIVPAIAGAPGSGGSISLTYAGTDYNTSTMEWTWQGTMSIASPGSGYLPNLNQRGVAFQSLPNSQVVQAGKTYTVNFQYGNGFFRAAVN